MKKLISIALMALIISCNKTETVGTAYTTDSSTVTGANYQANNDYDNEVPRKPMTKEEEYRVLGQSLGASEEDIEVMVKMNTINYSFVLFDAVESYPNNGNKRKLASNIFETSQDLNENDKYRILDEWLEEFKKSPESWGKSVEGRQLKSYLTYAEASKAREEYLGMSSN